MNTPSIVSRGVVVVATTTLALGLGAIGDAVPTGGVATGTLDGVAFGGVIGNQIENQK